MPETYDPRIGEPFAELGFETDDLPRRFCANCLGENRVRFDTVSGRRLCVECEPNPRTPTMESDGWVDR